MQSKQRYLTREKKREKILLALEVQHLLAFKCVEEYEDFTLFLFFLYNTSSIHNFQPKMKFHFVDTPTLHRHVGMMQHCIVYFLQY